MADELHTIEIAFKNPPNQPYIVRYRATAQARDQLINEFHANKPRAHCHAQTEDGDTRVLMLLFADVLYIG